MQMQPIVNGLQNEYNTRVEFITYNALDNAEGEAFFQRLGLPGHPSIVIYSVDGQQVYLGIGIIDEEQLQEEIRQVLSGG